MTGPWHPSGRGRVSARSPEALAVCDSCGFVYNHKNLGWQFQWAGVQLQNLRQLKCQRCLDVPQMQLRTIVIPPDPIPIYNPRPEQYDVEVPSFVMAEDRSGILTEDGSALIWEIEVTPSPDPANPVLYPP